MSCIWNSKDAATILQMLVLKYALFILSAAAVGAIFSMFWEAGYSGMTKGFCRYHYSYASGVVAGTSSHKHTLQFNFTVLLPAWLDQLKPNCNSMLM